LTPLPVQQLHWSWKTPSPKELHKIAEPAMSPQTYAKFELPGAYQI
jgi:hypothetical protein